MNKKIIIAIAILFPLISYANNLAPLPTKGLTIVPIAKTNIPEALKKHILRVKAEQEKNGYYESKDKDEYIRHLIKLKRNASSEIKSFKNSGNPYDTHLKENLSDITLAFPFKPVDTIKDINVTGYAAVGTFIHERSIAKKGWTGIGVFFNENKLGSCAYTFVNLKLSHGAAQLNNETTQYLVNNKPSSIIVEGNNNGGFLYDLIWFTPDTMSQLECANMLFDKSITSKLIAMAGVVDKRR